MSDLKMINSHIYYYPLPKDDNKYEITLMDETKNSISGSLIDSKKIIRPSLVSGNVASHNLSHWSQIINYEKFKKILSLFI